MERFTKRLHEDLAGASEGEASRGKKLRVAECDMDRQLVEVASAKFDDIHFGLLDHIFQCLYFTKILGVRRVCKEWNSAVTRKCAPFLRNVVIPMDVVTELRHAMSVRIKHFWLSASDATTLIVCGKAEPGGSEDKKIDIKNFWNSYTLGDVDRRRRINKVIYVNLLVHSDVFGCPAVLNVGFRTMLYHSTLKLPTGAIFSYDENGNENRHFMNSVTDGVNVMVQVSAADSYSLKESDLVERNDRRLFRSLNAVADHFARKNCAYLDDTELVLLTEGDSVRNFGSAGAVRNLVKQLIDRFDPGNEEALSLFNGGDVTGFAKAAHPLVSVFLYRFVKYSDDLIEASEHYQSPETDSYYDVWGTDDDSG